MQYYVVHIYLYNKVIWPYIIEMTTMLNLITICLQTKLLQSYQAYSLCSVLHPHGLFIL